MPADGEDADLAVLDRLRLPEALGTVPGPVPTKVKQGYQFVKFPRVWAEPEQCCSVKR
jgi:hypothetical protein